MAIDRAYIANELNDNMNNRKVVCIAEAAMDDMQKMKIYWHFSKNYFKFLKDKHGFHIQSCQIEIERPGDQVYVFYCHF